MSRGMCIIGLMFDNVQLVCLFLTEIKPNKRPLCQKQFVVFYNQ